MSCFELLHATPDWLLIDKAPGVGFHREGDTPGLLEYVAAASGDAQLYPVHRLDRITSGLLLIARHRDSAAALSQQFAERSVDKLYLALSVRKPNKKQGRISGDMAKARGGSWRLLRSRDNPALTEFRSFALAEGGRLFLLRPRTGRTHQLRVAMKSLGAPILGDSRYGGGQGDAARGYLHAYGLRFEWGGQRQQFLLPPRSGACFTSASVSGLLAGWDDPWQLFATGSRPES